jgi:prepilin-type N-terminal cleavage/methylation domain-containing protein
MRLKAFTLVEILVTVLIIAILSSFGVVLWDNSVDSARQRICAQNQYILLESLKMYIYDKDTVPVSLSSIVPEYSEFAIAKISRENPMFKPTRSISLALININDGRQAWALSRLSDYIKGNSGILRCPAKEGDGLSYAYNAVLTTGDALTKFRELESQNLPIICDSNNATFQAPNGNISGAAFRHGRRLIAAREIALSAGGGGIRQITPNNISYPDSPLGWSSAPPKGGTPGASSQQQTQTQAQVGSKGKSSAGK